MHRAAGTGNKNQSAQHDARTNATAEFFPHIALLKTAFTVIIAHLKAKTKLELRLVSGVRGFLGAFFSAPPKKTGLSAPIFFAAKPQKRISAAIPRAEE
jgi:hypothetical protein